MCCRPRGSRAIRIFIDRHHIGAELCAQSRHLALQIIALCLQRGACHLCGLGP